MLRLKVIIRGDIKCQWKYGFYFIYIVMVLLYLGILSLLQGDVKEGACHIMIYSDPAAMGMFFMGAIVLLEKSQRVLNTIAVSPVTATEYILGKVISIGIISVIVGGILTVTVKNNHMLLTLLGICLASFLFTLLGLIVGANIESLTQYVIGTLPFEILGFVPPIAYSLGWQKDNIWMLLHPGCAMMKLIQGSEEYIVLAIVSSTIWLGVVFCITRRCITKMLKSVGGVTL
ncbi:fluoroquinolone export ABC transporter permease subunit [Lachnospiraceae bacterium LCP25S3_G4]